MTFSKNDKVMDNPLQATVSNIIRIIASKIEELNVHLPAKYFYRKIIREVY